MDRALTIATGQAVAVVAVILQRGGLVSVEEFGEVLGVLAQAGESSAAAESHILDLWSKMIRDSGRAIAEEMEAAAGVVDDHALSRGA